MSELHPHPYGAVGPRAGDADRAAVADTLSSHFAAGRLSLAELDDRLGRAMAARTTADLFVLLRDLPRPARPVGPPAPATPPARLGWRTSDGLVLALLICSTLLAGGLLVVLGTVNTGVFVGAVFGGLAAATGGIAVGHLAHRVVAVARSRPDPRT